MELPHELQNNSTNHGFHEGTAGVSALERHYYRGRTFQTLVLQ